ncbi:amino acid adenylation domain-containing protein [Actinocorallia sp. A-T 12471]|uniref:non-ribosomal peptide synthetase n=1 Tax=Actinocorallia sp. A-T 12471 TaxID=3089813 RepID=UPI0029CEA709|nr:amino acid adenylation domain-containing protein [Actinocorallia sp. A-T 12471]MDX6739390.1 amino acid adenylation domain-containing protein [Actinocorallia sp. A-T 12471]
MKRRATLRQHDVWFAARAGRDGYTMRFSVTFSGTADLPRMRAAVSAVLARHPVLACAVREEDGVLYLVPAASPPRIEDGPADAVAPFDLERGPLTRIGLEETAYGCRLTLAAHHLVFDGASKSVFLRDLAAAYAGEALPPLPDADLAEEEAARVADALGTAREYWKPRWRAPEPVALPFQEGACPSDGPGAQLTFRLADLPEIPGTSRFEVLLASVQALLWRYGNPSAAVGVDLGTRAAADRDRIGMFAAELPVFARIDPEWSFLRLARSLRFEHGLSRDLRGLFRVREVPLSRAVSGITPETALPPVSLSYRRRDTAPDFPGLTADVDWISFNGVGRGALRLVVVDGPSGCDVGLQYQPAHLGAEAAERIAGHWRGLLDRVAVDPDVPLADLVDDPAPRHDTGVAYPAVTLVDLFEEQARRTPEAVAVLDDGRALTYADLNAAADAVAAGLASGSLVAVVADRSADTVVAQLGVLKAGAAYLPLDPSHPPARLAFQLADAAPAVVVAPKRLLESIPPGDVPVLVLEDAVQTGAARPASRPSPEDLAYVLYTSGSTGQPKGVEIGHAALTNLLLAVQDRLGDQATPVWLGLTSPSFDISALETYLPLITGGRLVVAPEALTGDGPALTALVAREGVTHVQATPSGWQVLLDGGPADVVALVGGEALPAPLAAELRARTRRVLNMYGPTETTIWSTCAEVAGPVTIGTPLANTTVHVLDEGLRPLPHGVPGELCVGGAGLAFGYLNRPELTAERFVTGPDGTRIYRTGDLARFRADGDLEYLGRRDGQVKLRGHRIETGEVEARLLEHPDVARAAVAVRDVRLIAYVVAPAGISVAELRAHCAATLPPIMVPARFVTLDALPLTPNGKLDRNALPEPETAPSADASALTGTARAVQEIVGEVLRLPGIGPEDDLFDLGVHSLLITQIGVRIRARIGPDLPLHVFYDTPTIAGLAAYADRLLTQEAK